jgi:lipopolysaccharide assembly outer membrane protein LptD (OstA)
MIEREISNEKYIGKCPYSCEGKFELKDVTPNMQVKRYSDSQYMSFYSNNLGKGNTTQGQLPRFGKENMSPDRTTNQEIVRGGNMRFQNSAANGFSRGGLLLDDGGNATL